MKTKMSRKSIVTLALLTALAAGASAQTSNPSGASSGSAAQEENVSAHFADGAPIASGGEYAVELEAKGNGATEIGSTAARQVEAYHSAGSVEACRDADYDEAAVEQVYDYNKEHNSLAEHGTDPEAKFELKLSWKKSKAQSGKKCLKGATVTFQKKRADGMDGLPAVHVTVKKSAGPLGAFAAAAVEFMIAQAPAPAGASTNRPTSHVKIDSNGAAAHASARE